MSTSTNIPTILILKKGLHERLLKGPKEIFLTTWDVIQILADPINFTVADADWALDRISFAAMHDAMVQNAEEI